MIYQIEWEYIISIYNIIVNTVMINPAPAARYIYHAPSIKRHTTCVPH